MRRFGALSFPALALLAGCFQSEAPLPAAPSRPADAAAQARARVGAAVAPTHDAAMPTVADLSGQALQDPDPAIRQDAVYRLADVSDRPGTPVIGQALTDPDPGVRSAAVEALVGVGGDESARLLAAALNDADPRIRLDAVDALAEVGGPTALLALQQAYVDGDPTVREAAAEAIEELSARRPEKPAR